MNFKGHSIFKVVRFFKQTLLFVLLTGAPPLLAQLNPGNLKQYTELDGLPASEVGSILPDRNGYIWVGTLNGLTRYDGYEFKRFFNNPNDPGSIKGLQVWSLFEDRKGRIWIATSPANLNVYDPVTRSFKTQEYKHLIDHNANVELGITTMCEDLKGRIYFGVSTNYGENISNSILYLDEGDSAIHRFNGLDSLIAQNVMRMVTDPEGNIWIITYSGLFKIDPLRRMSKLTDWFRVFENLGDFPLDLKFGPNGRLWIISWNSVLFEFDPKSDKYYSYKVMGSSIKNLNNTIALDPRGNVWIGTDRGLSLFNTTSKEFMKFDYEGNHPMQQALVRTISPDEFGNLWVGTHRQGLFKFEEKAVFTSFGYKNDPQIGLTAGWANNIFEARNGIIYVATSGPPETSGLNILDPETQTITRLFTYAQIATDGGLSFIEYAPNEVYLSSWRGPVYQLSMPGKKVKKINLEGIEDTLLIQKFFEDKKGNLWIGTTKGLYRKIKGGTVFTKYDLSLNGLGDASSNEISNFFESTKHGLWLLTNNGLFLYKYETDQIERHGYDPAQGDIFLTQDINSLYEDSSGLPWVGTWQGGLSNYDVSTKKIVTYTLDNGLPSMSIQSILGDEKKDVLWLSTFDGLSRLDLREKKFYNYSISDGIQGQLFADGAALKTSKGHFIFGGSNGITMFNPDQIKESSHPPRVFLTNLKLFDQTIIPGHNSVLSKPLQETDKIVLKSNQNNITLEFAALHYSNPAKNRVLYQLEEYENEWRDAGGQHLAFYPKLPPGQYNFRVKAANNNGVWNTEGASLKIIILPPWWKTTWAYLGYLIILIAGGFSLDRYLRHRIIKKEREQFQTKQLEQAKEIEKAYHDLGQAHETLKATQAQLIQSEKMASLGELTAGIAHEIQNPLNFVNNFSEINIELLEELKGQRSRVKNERNEQVETELLKDIEENEEKINHHGKRADAIVKGMLQHSRLSTGIKEPTDINTLADEYFRLAYHGLRAKDKSFNATMVTDFDQTIGVINIIPQDISRVILNLFTNAFYAVAEKKKQLDLEGRTGYDPTVTVSSKKINHKMELRIRDNGPGIPAKNLDKIFQPFFTTKPVGQGTGLGLSISYDIVKANGGELKVNSMDGEGSEFIIQLPV